MARSRTPRKRTSRSSWFAFTRLHRRWQTYAAGVAAILVVAAIGGTTYFYKSYARMIDARLHGERERSLPRVFARPVELRRGQSLSEQELIARLNDLGYAQRARADAGGEFVVARNIVTLNARGGEAAGKPVRVTFPLVSAANQTLSGSRW